MTAATSAPQTSAIVAPGDSSRSRWIWILTSLLLGGVILLLPTPHGLSPLAHRVVAILAFAVLLWASQGLNSGITSILMLGLLIVAGVRPSEALSGFASPPFWLLLTVLFYGFAMKKSGLAERVSYSVLSLAPCSYGGILGAFLVVGFILSLGIPSMTVRTAIMTPIAWALVQSLGLKKFSRGSALIVLTTVEMAILPGLAFLSGSLAGPVVEAAFQAKNLPISWLSYARIITLPTILLCVMILVANYLVLRPEARLTVSTTFARERLGQLGAIRASELITAIVVLVSVLFWTTDTHHHLPSFLIGMIAMAVFAATGILEDHEIATGVSWSLLLFLGGIFGLSNVIQNLKVTDWFARAFVPMISHVVGALPILAVFLALTMFVLRFIDPSSLIAIPVLFLSVVDVTAGAGIPPLVLMAPILIASMPFWLLYQNFWMVLAEGITQEEAFTPKQRTVLATIYAIVVVLTVMVSTGYWKMIGTIH
jgi:anion transporter